MNPYSGSSSETESESDETADIATFNQFNTMTSIDTWSDQKLNYMFQMPFYENNCTVKTIKTSQASNVFVQSINEQIQKHFSSDIVWQASDVSSISGPPGIKPNPYSWFYIDVHNQVQGPFTDYMMRQWYEAKRFYPEYVMWRSCDKRRSTLAELFTLCQGSCPFGCKTPLPPITEQIPQVEQRSPLLPEVMQLSGSTEINKKHTNLATAVGLPANADEVSQFKSYNW